jgi:hypothetical protein
MFVLSVSVLAVFFEGVRMEATSGAAHSGGTNMATHGMAANTGMFPTGTNRQGFASLFSGNGHSVSSGGEAIAVQPGGVAAPAPYVSTGNGADVGAAYSMGIGSNNMQGADMSNLMNHMSRTGNSNYNPDMGSRTTYDSSRTGALNSETANMYNFGENSYGTSASRSGADNTGSPKYGAYGGLNGDNSGRMKYNYAGSTGDASKYKIPNSRYGVQMESANGYAGMQEGKSANSYGLSGNMYGGGSGAYGQNSASEGNMKGGITDLLSGLLSISDMVSSSQGLAHGMWTFVVPLVAGSLFHFFKQ